MRFTTHFEQQSQATRLFGHVSYAANSGSKTEVGGQAVLGRQNILPTPWLTERHGYDPTSSRYLFAIGLWPIFSFRWGLPPILSSNPKLLDSSDMYRTRRTPGQRRDFHPLWSLVPKELYPGHTQKTSLEITTRMPVRTPDFHFELFPLHSPLLGESLLVSFPPLNNMLKFGGSSQF